MTIAPKTLANAVRALSMDAVEAAKSGHPGMPMGMADAATVLFTRYLRHDPAAPDWADRDRFVLSAGHGSMLIYSLLHLTGYARPTIDDIRAFRQLHSPCAGHPENFELSGVEATTGPLGSGLATAVGMAIAERHLNGVFGDGLVDHKTWVIAGDGCLMEGVNHEAVGLAGNLKLGRLNVLWDDNRITIDGAVELSSCEDVEGRYRASGWHVVACDGHDADDVARALEEAIADERPSLIRCRTIIGYGAPNKQGTSATHGSPLGAIEVAAAREALGWSAEPFQMPAEVAAAWAQAGQRCRADRAAWLERAAADPNSPELTRRMRGDLPAGFTLDGHIDALLAEPKTVATRVSSQLALDAINALLPETIGGSADLTGSNNTHTKGLADFTPDNASGRYIRYGIREFGMGCAMNGMALHGGVIPYGGTFLSFADYCRPAIRLAAIQRIRSIFVMTHDSVGLGEDGPTHQPIEHMMSLRVIPNLDTYRPADAVEAAECWELALTRADRPSVLALSRQNLPQLRREKAENLSARGAYRLKAAEGARRVILIATGSEVDIALATAAQLEAKGIGADVVSMPCWSRFDAQPQSWRDDVLPPVDPSQILRVSIEAGTTMGWERYTMVQGLRFGIDSFGASGPIADLYRYFGLTADLIAPKIIAALDQQGVH